MRFLRELFHPEARCSRVGHSGKIRYRRFYEYPSTSNGVADRVTYRCVYCRRCRQIIEREEYIRLVIHALEMDTGRWEELRRDGVIETA